MAALGLVILYKVGEWFYSTDFEDMSLTTIAFVILALSIGVLLVARPMSILDMARKKIGMDPKKNINDTENDREDAS